MQNAESRPIAAAHQDNMIGICHAIGTDFGFNPLYLRIALAVMLLFDPVAMLVTYGAAGLLVLASRLLVRARPRASVKAETPWVPEIATVSHAAPEHILEAA